MPSIGKPIESFPFFNELLKQVTPEDSIGLGLWTNSDMTVWLKSEGSKKWIGILDEGKLAIETHFVIVQGFPKSIVFAGGAIGDGASWESTVAEDQLERVATLAKTLSASMRPVIVVSERALADAREFQDDRASALLLQDLDAHLGLLSNNGAWLPKLFKR